MANSFQHWSHGGGWRGGWRGGRRRWGWAHRGHPPWQPPPPPDGDGGDDSGPPPPPSPHLPFPLPPLPFLEVGEQEGEHYGHRHPGRSWYHDQQEIGLNSPAPGAAGEEEPRHRGRWVRSRGKLILLGL
jgi:hypothetical protein